MSETWRIIDVRVPKWWDKPFEIRTEDEWLVVLKRMRDGKRKKVQVWFSGYDSTNEFMKRLFIKRLVNKALYGSEFRESGENSSLAHMKTLIGTEIEL